MTHGEVSAAMIDSPRRVTTITEPQPSEESRPLMGAISAALEARWMAEARRLMEHALDLNIEWVTLTMAVQKGVAQGYRQTSDD